jgi:23S rRNA pseudouridine955/2504/2580 synthase
VGREGGGVSEQVRQFTVTEEDDGIRLDRWFKRNLPEANFTIVARMARTGQLRVDGKRATPGDRIAVGQIIRVPPIEQEQSSPSPRRTHRPLSEDQVAYARSMVIAEDPAAIVLNKPPGLATQGGTGTTEHVDGLLSGLVAEDAAAPNSSTGSTRTRRARCSWPAPRAQLPSSPNPFPAAPRARSIGRW